MRNIRRRSLATRLLRVSTAIYASVVLATTVLHMVLEYRRQRTELTSELRGVQSAFSGGITDAFWKMDEQALSLIISGMLEIPVISGIRIVNPVGGLVAVGGIIQENSRVSDSELRIGMLGLNPNKEPAESNLGSIRLFEITNDLIYRTLSGDAVFLGSMTVYSDSSIIFQHIQYQLLLILINIGFSFMVFWLAVRWAFHRYLGIPLQELIRAAGSITLENIRTSEIRIGAPEESELKSLEMAFNQMIRDLGEAIRQRETAEKALDKSESMFRIIFEKSTDAIFVLNSNTGQYLDANQSAEKITGRTIEEIRKLTTFDITPENASERLAAANKSRQAIEYGEIVYIQPDGQERTAILRAVTIDDELVYGFATDITERKEAENHLSNMIRSLEQRVAQSKAGLDRSEGELNELLDKLNSIQEEVIRSERLKAVGTMVAGVAHEINTPIGIAVTGVSYIAEVLQEIGQGEIHDSPAPRELLQTARIVLDNLRRASDLIRRFKMVAVEQIDEQTSDISMRQLLSDLIFSYLHKLKKSKSVINLDCAEEIHYKGSAGDLLQIFSNLIENSIIHGRPDEENADVLHIEIAVREQNSRIEIRYTDDGRGIHESIRGRIFEPFFTTRRSEGGTGLGLHIVYKIVEDRLLGTIELLDLPIGTGFSVSFPAAYG